MLITCVVRETFGKTGGVDALHEDVLLVEEEDEVGLLQEVVVGHLVKRL